MKTVWIATNNAHKAQEFSSMFSDQNVQVKTLKDLPVHLSLEEIEETGTTFEENALIKARALYERLNQSVIADDSGIEVDAMNGAPGIYSARFLGENTPQEVKNKAILEAVKGKERSARYVCVIAWIEEDGTEHIYRGTMEGLIHTEPVGEQGFGYDPIFYYPPFKTTCANVSAEIKNKESHRAKALEKFIEDWRKN